MAWGIEGVGGDYWMLGSGHLSGLTVPFRCCSLLLVYDTVEGISEYTPQGSTAVILWAIALGLIADQMSGDSLSCCRWGTSATGP